MAKEESEKVSENKVVVVPELPTQPYNVVPTEDGKGNLTLMTISDALTEIYEDIKEIKKAVA